MEAAAAAVTDLQCGPFPGPGSGSEHHISMNPMHEFIHRADDHVEDAFERFKRAHSKNYRDKATHEKRKHNFRHNFRSVAVCWITSYHYDMIRCCVFNEQSKTDE